MSGVEDKCQVMFAANVDNLVIVPCVSADSDKHDSAGTLRNFFADGSRAQAHGVINIGEDNFQARFQNRVIRRDIISSPSCQPCFSFKMSTAKFKPAVAEFT